MFFLAKDGLKKEYPLSMIKGAFLDSVKNELEVSIDTLRPFDSEFLLCNKRFSTKDEFGNDRNNGNDTFGRTVFNKKDREFEDVITAITHKILRECYKRDLWAMGLYNINEFIITTSNEAPEVGSIVSDVFIDFMSGKTFRIDGE